MKDLVSLFDGLGYLLLDLSIIDKKAEKNSYSIYKYFDDNHRKCMGDFTAVFSVTPDERYVFKNQVYNSPEDLIDAAREFYNKLEIPAYCDDPFLRDSAKIEKYFKDYMTCLGFEDATWDEGGWTSWGGTTYYKMVLRNIYGEPVSKLTLSIDNNTDSLSGEILRSIGDGWSWVSAKFTGYEDLRKCINDILGPEILVNAAKGVTAVANMTSERGDEVKIETLDTRSLSVISRSIKNEVIRILENELELLKK